MRKINYLMILLFSFLCSIKANNSLVCFFLVLIPYLYIIYNNKLVLNKKSILLSILMSFLILFFTYSFFVYKPKTDKLVIKNISDVPVNIDGVYKDNKKIKTNYKYDKNNDINDTNGDIDTEYKRYNKINSKYKMTLRKNDSYTINIKNVKNVLVCFQPRKDVSYKVKVNDKILKINRYEYDSSDYLNFIIGKSYNYRYHNIKHTSLSIYSFLLVLFLLYIYFMLILYALNSSRLFGMLFLPVILVFNDINYLTILSKIFFFSVAFVLLLNTKKNTKSLQQLIVSLMISFSFVGQKIIESSFNIKLFLLYIFITIIVYLILPVIIFLLEKNKIVVIANKRHRIIVFLLTFSICMFYISQFYPYIIHADTTMHLKDIENGIYRNWHPYFYTVILSFFKNVFGNVNYFMYFRILIYSLLLNQILFYFNKKGMTIFTVYITSILLTLSPVTGVLLSTLIKDVDFTIALVALTFYFIVIINDYEYFHNNKFNYLFLALSIICVALFRHNGLYVSIASLFCLVIYNLKAKRKMLYCSVIISLISIYLVLFPFYKLLGVKQAPRNFDVAGVIHGITYVLVENGKVNINDYEYIDKHVYDGRDYSKYYNKYNIDSILYYNGLNIKNKKINKFKILSIYFKQLFKTPITLVIDRLYGTNIMWDVFEKDYIYSYKYQIKYDEFGNNYYSDFKIKPNKYISSFLVSISQNELLATLLFRTGLYFDLLLILLYNVIKYDRKKIVVFVPVFINILTLILTMHHQSFRYVWFIQLVSLLILLMLRYKNNVIKE